jgi:16S rRNA (guanine1516-N2)-methyltransferase
MGVSCLQISMTLDGSSANLVFTPAYLGQDEQLCQRFGIACADAASDEQWQLSRTLTGALALRSPKREGSLEITLDPTRGDLGRRIKTARPDQPLPRAVGLYRRDTPPCVVDATAGLGRDALLLARLGCKVIACERNPALCALIEDLADRCGLADRLTVHCADAVDVLAQRAENERPDVVYLDPMFEFTSQSQVKKEMQVLRLLAHEPADTSRLLHAAFAAATERIVVKRHPHLEPLRGQPAHTVDGERVRFDVYLQPKR